MSARLHVAVASDLAYVPHVAALLQSLAASHAPGTVVAHFLHDASVSAGDVERMRLSATQAGLHFHAYQPSTSQLARLSVSLRYPQVVWYRILLPELLPEVERVLYLDADTLVLQDLSPLWALDLADYPLAAVEDVQDPAHAHVPLQIGLARREDYFNSGVMLMNLEVMRAQHFTEALLEVARSRQVQDFPDQIALNILVKGYWLHLPPKWNCMSPFIEQSDRAGEVAVRTPEQRLAAASPCILHFEGDWRRGKPWHYLCNHPQQWLYLHYRALTPWPLVELQGRTWKSRIAKRLPRCMLDFILRLRA